MASPREKLLPQGALLCSSTEINPAKGGRGVLGKQPRFCKSPSAPSHSPYVEVLDVDVFVRGCLSLTPQEQPFLRRGLCEEGDDKRRGQWAGSVQRGVLTHGKPHRDHGVHAHSHEGSKDP